MLPIDEIKRDGNRVVVDRLHALPGQRTGILDLAVSSGPDDTTRSEFLPEGRAVGRYEFTGIVLMLRLLFGVQVIEIAVELVEAMVRRQMLVTIAQVVLAELARGIAASLEQAGDSRVFLLETPSCTNLV